MSAYVGSARGKQDVTGAVLAHIKDLSVSHANEKGHKGNTAYTTDKQVFHTDVGDLIALICLSTSEEGGTSRLSSCPRVYNEIAATRPDLIRVLAEPWPHDRWASDSMSIPIISILTMLIAVLVGTQDIPPSLYSTGRMATLSFSTRGACSLVMENKPALPTSQQ